MSLEPSSFSSLPTHFPRYFFISGVSSAMSFPTFGSVGDILAVAQLAYQIAQALSESRGSSAEYQELIIELDALADVLHGLDETISRQHMDVAVRNAIKHATGRCWTLMTSFLGRIDGYKSSLAKKADGKGGGNKWKAVWRSIGWMLFRKEELVEFREKLSDQKATITLMLTLSSCASLSKFESKVRDTTPVVIEPAPSSKEELAEYIQRVIESQRADTERSYQEVLDAMRQTAHEQVPFNIQGYMDEFSKSIASEVRVLLGEVGQLREERRQLQYEVGELLRLRSQMGPDQPQCPPPPTSPPLPLRTLDDKPVIDEMQDVTSPEQSSDYVKSLAAAQTELGFLLQLKSKYGPGGEFDPDWRPPANNSTLPTVSPSPPPSESILMRPAWPTIVQPPVRQMHTAPGPTVEIPQETVTPWASWQPSPDFIPSPPPEYSRRT